MEEIQAFYDSIKGHPSVSDPTFNCSQSSPQGFHFTITCQLHSVPANDPNSFHALLYLPTSLFFDTYELEQRSSDGDGPVTRIWGETNLELPLASEKLDWRGSFALLELGSAFRESFSLPLHARYLMPSGRTHGRVDVEWPIVFAVEDSFGKLGQFRIISYLAHL